MQAAGEDLGTNGRVLDCRLLPLCGELSQLELVDHTREVAADPEELPVPVRYMAIDEINGFTLDCGDKTRGEMTADTGRLARRLTDKYLGRLFAVQRRTETGKDSSGPLRLSNSRAICRRSSVVLSGEYKTGRHSGRRSLLRRAFKFTAKLGRDVNLDVRLINLNLAGKDVNLSGVRRRCR